jgi:hypothetical protein
MQKCDINRLNFIQELSVKSLFLLPFEPLQHSAIFQLQYSNTRSFRLDPINQPRFLGIFLNQYFPATISGQIHRRGSPIIVILSSKKIV